MGSTANNLPHDEERVETGERLVAEEWTPGTGVAMLWNVLGAGLVVVGVVAFSVVYTIAKSEVSVSFRGGEFIPVLLVTLAITMLLLALHELLHGAAMRAFGAHPTYGVTLVGRVVPAFYTTAEDYRFTRSQYVAIALAPVVVISLVGAVVMAFAPFGGWLVLPLAVNLGGSIGDLWMVALVLGQPSGTLVEDRKSGVILWRQVPHVEPPDERTTHPIATSDRVR